MTDATRIRQETNLTASNQYSHSIWVKPDDLSAVISFDRISFLNAVCLLDVNSSGDVRLRDNGAPVFSTITASGALTTGVWSHIICSVTTTLATFMIDGTLIGTETVSVDPVQATGFHISENATGVGLIGEYERPMVWKFALSQQEMITIYQSRNKTIPKFDNLIIDWGLNVKEDGATVVTDDVTNRADPPNTESIVSGSPVYGSSGKLNSRKRYR